jgi:hypothetical protein
MSNRNGLLAPQATHANVEVPYYAAKVAPVFVEPLSILSQDESTNANIFVNGEDAGAYMGAINITPGVNTTALLGAGAGITIRTVAGSVAGSAATTVEIGTNTQGGNNLLIAGLSGTGRVYDEVYNQPVALQAITMVTENPNCARDPANTSEIFRCAQAAVAAADAGTGQGNSFTVPRTGFYALQLEVNLFNAAAPAAVTVNVPAIVAAGIDVYGSLGFSMTDGGVTVLPYGAHEMVGGELFSSDCLVQGSGVNKVHTGMYLLTAGTTYGFVMGASRPAGSTAWNIGTNGQIKAELIAMC